MSEHKDELDLLDRATSAMRDEGVAPVSPDLIARTQVRVRETVESAPDVRVAVDERAPFRHPLFRSGECTTRVIEV